MRKRDTVREIWWGAGEHETETHMQRQQRKMEEDGRDKKPRKEPRPGEFWQ